MREALIGGVARQLGVVASKRVSLAVGVWGEPGIGKSHVARAVLGQLLCHHLQVHATTPLAQLWGMLPRTRPLPGWAQAQFERLERGEVLGPQALVHMLMAALGTFAPCVLHIEDLHEADPERRALIQALAQAVTHTRGVGLLVTSRTALPAPFRGHRLEPLSFAETAALIEQELQAAPPPDGAEWIFGRTGGNPLFTLEFVRYLRRQGHLSGDGTWWHWRAPHPDFVPVTVEAVIEQLTARLATTPDLLAVLEAKALLPRRAEVHDWMATSALDPAGFERAAAQLTGAGVFHEGGFAHPLIGEVTGHAIPQDRRRVYARRAIAHLEQRDPLLAVELIDQADLGQSEALALLRLAVERARAQGTLALTAQLLGLAAERASGDERVRLALEAEALFRSSGAPDRCVHLARLALAEQPTHPEARRRLATALALMGQDEEVGALVAELPEAQRREAHWVRAVFHAQVHAAKFADALGTWLAHPELARNPANIVAAVTTYSNLNDAHSSEALIVKTLERADLPTGLHANLTGLLASIRSRQGHLEEAQALHDRSLSLARQGANATTISASLHNGSFNLSRLGRHADAVSALEEAAQGYDRSGLFHYGADTRIQLGANLARMGRFEQAETALMRAFDTLRTLDEVSPSLTDVESELALLYLAWQPPHGASLALRFARHAVAHARQLAAPRGLLGALPAAARVEAWAGDPQRALALAGEANALEMGSVDDRHDCAFALGLALEAAGRTADARALWQRTVQTAETPEARHSAELEQARLAQDHARVRELLAWFEARGLGALVRRAQRCLPEEGSGPAATLPSARIQALGPVVLLSAGQPVSMRARKRAEVLAYLLESRVAGRAEASTLELLDTFYPDLPEAEAKKALKQHIYLIRSSLGLDSVLSTAGGYALGAVTSDVEDFLRTSDPALWRGRYLGGLADGWHPTVRDALTLALRAQAEQLLDARPAEAARLAATLVEMEPFDVQALYLLVQSLGRAAQPGAARAAYRQGALRLLDLGESVPETLEGLLATRTTA